MLVIALISAIQREQQQLYSSQVLLQMQIALTHKGLKHSRVNERTSKITGGKCLVLPGSSLLHNLKFSWSSKTPTFYHPGKNKSVLNWKVFWNYAALTFKNEGEEVQEGPIVSFLFWKSLLKSSSHRRWHSLEAAPGRRMMGFFWSWRLTAHRGFQRLKGCWCEAYTNEVYENWGFWAPLCVIEYTRRII